MKHQYNNFNLKQLVLFAIVNLFLISCGTYQNVSNDDGIYEDETIAKRNKEVKNIEPEKVNKVVPENSKENAFTRELERLQIVNGGQIFTDIDSYNSDEAIEEDVETIGNSLEYDENAPWGESDNVVYVNINLNTDPFWGGFNNWGYSYWGFNNWRYRNLGYWGLYNPYWHPLHRGYPLAFGFYNGYYCPPIYNRPWNNRYTNNRHYAFNNRRFRNSNSRYRTNNNRRYASNNRSSNRIRRGTSTRNRNSSNRINRNSYPTTRRRSSGFNRGSSSRNNSRIRRSSSSRNNRSSSSYRGRSSSSSRSSANRSSTRSSSRSSSGRSSSSRRRN